MKHHLPNQPAWQIHRVLPTAHTRLLSALLIKLLLRPHSKTSGACDGDLTQRCASYAFRLSSEPFARARSAAAAEEVAKCSKWSRTVWRSALAASGIFGTILFALCERVNFGFLDFFGCGVRCRRMSSACAREVNACVNGKTRTWVFTYHFW